MAEEIRLALETGRLLNQQKLWVVTADSCTGGLLGHLITNVAGSSGYYLGGLIAYSNAAKERWLGVAPATIETYGAVSEETVLEMARGARAAFSDQLDPDRVIGIAISGIAGPGGGTPEKPVGTVWIGLSACEKDTAECFHFKGIRASVKNQSALQALKMLNACLSHSKTG